MWWRPSGTFTRPGSTRTRSASPGAVRKATRSRLRRRPASPGQQATGAGTTTGAVTGAVAGASLGGLVGLGIMVGMFPAIGLVVAGGTLAAILANAAGGAAIGGVLGSLTGDSYPQDQPTTTRSVRRPVEPS